MAIDTTLAGLLLSGERELLNPVMASPGDSSRLDAYADWLADRDPTRAQFLRQFIDACASWDAASFPDAGDLSAVWLDLIGFRIAHRLAERKLSSFSELIFGLARPALRLQHQSTSDEELPVGTSKYGGLPDLPPDIAWPVGDDCRATCNDDTAGEQRLAGFVCQIDLNELQPAAAASVLPASGLLSFFGFQDMENDNPDKIGVRAMWFPDRSVLERRSPPRELTEGNQCFEPARIVLEEFLDLPSGSGPWRDDLAEVIRTDQEAFEFGTWDNIRNMLGYAVGTSGDDATPDRQSRHLIFVDADVSGWQWPSLHIQIDGDDLARRAFERIRLVWVDWD